MTLTRTEHRSTAAEPPGIKVSTAVPVMGNGIPPALPVAPSLEHTVRALHTAGHGQRAIARELNIDRRKVKRIIDQAA